MSNAVLLNAGPNNAMVIDSELTVYANNVVAALEELLTPYLGENAPILLRACAIPIAMEINAAIKQIELQAQLDHSLSLQQSTSAIEIECEPSDVSTYGGAKQLSLELLRTLVGQLGIREVISLLSQVEKDAHQHVAEISHKEGVCLEDSIYQQNARLLSAIVTRLNE